MPERMMRGRLSAASTITNAAAMSTDPKTIVRSTPPDAIVFAISKEGASAFAQANSKHVRTPPTTMLTATMSRKLA